MRTALILLFNTRKKQNPNRTQISLSPHRIQCIQALQTITMQAKIGVNETTNHYIPHDLKKYFSTSHLATNEKQ